MKKVFTILSVIMALTAFSTPASAQFTFDKDIIEPVSHIGFGYNIVNTNAFKSSYSEEFFVNILTLNLFPVENFGVQIGVDYKTVGFESKDDAFYLDGNKKVQAEPFKDKYPVSYTKNYSRFRTNTFSAPVMLTVEAGNFSMSAGAEANLNLTGRVKDKYLVNGKKVKNIDKGAQFNRFNYNFIFSLSYDDTGLYVKYYPKSSKLMPEGSIDLDFWSVGVVFDM